MAPFQSDSQRPWKEYYALRNRARLGLLTTTICLYLFVVKPPSTLLDRLNNLPDALKLTVVLAGIGLVTIVVAAPVLKWAEWRCPRCGNKFAHPKTEFGGLFVLLYTAWRLVSGWRCATCGFSCGTDLEQPNFNNN